MLLRLIVTMYGWYGSDRPRMNGELTVSTRPPEVTYIVFSSDLRERLPAALDDTREFNTFDFGVTPKEGNEQPTTVATPGDLPDDVRLGIICGVVLAALLIVLVIVLVCVFGRRRRDKPRPK